MSDERHAGGEQDGKGAFRRDRQELWRRLIEHASEAGPPEEWEGIGRRDFMKLVGASVALAGCSREPVGKLLPYTVRPVGVTPGVPDHFATAMAIDGRAVGLIVESHEGRPTKIEGNPAHPASLGAAGVFEQAAVLQLYDPSRAGALRMRGRDASWESFCAAFSQPRTDGGEGLRFLLPPDT